MRPRPDARPSAQTRRRRGAALAAAVAVALLASTAAPACDRSPGASGPPGLDAGDGGASALGPPVDAAARGPETPEQRAARLHDEAIIVDGHDDIPSVMLATGLDLASPDAGTHTDLARMKSGGVTGEFLAIYVDRALAEHPTTLGGGPARRALDLIDIVYQQVERHPDQLLLATSTDDIRRAKREKKVACLMGVEGGHAIENSLAALRELHRLGVRYMTLTHTNDNPWATSSGGPDAGANRRGLTAFGERVVREMQRIGMLVDVSHVSDATFADVMRVAKAPVIASHSSCRALCDAPRNLTDDQLRDLAKNGGVAMINFWPKFDDPSYRLAAETWSKAHGGDAGAPPPNVVPRPPLSIIVDHIDHAVRVAGIDHVGLGSDFDGIDALPEGMTGIDDLPKITLELVRRGYSDDDVKKVLGANFMRVFAAAEAFARATHTTLSGDGDTTSISSSPTDAGR